MPKLQLQLHGDLISVMESPTELQQLQLYGNQTYPIDRTPNKRTTKKGERTKEKNSGTKGLSFAKRNFLLLIG